MFRESKRRLGIDELQGIGSCCHVAVQIPNSTDRRPLGPKTSVDLSPPNPRLNPCCIGPFISSNTANNLCLCLPVCLSVSLRSALCALPSSVTGCHTKHAMKSERIYRIGAFVNANHKNDHRSRVLAKHMVSIQHHASTTAYYGRLITRYPLGFGTSLNPVFGEVLRSLLT